MSYPDVPPRLDEVPVEVPRPKWRWALHLTLLIGYVLALGIAGLFRPQVAGAGASAMPNDVRALLTLCAFEIVLFAIVAALAWSFSRAGPDELFLRWRGGLRPFAWGILYSVALRFAVLVVVMMVAIPLALTKGEKSVEKLRPKVEAVVDTEALKDPVYLLVALTAISFVVAGFREELWRAGVIAGLAGVAPRIFGTRRGQYLAVVIAAVIFGLGHLPQGWGGVGLTCALGLGLGFIIVRHRSIWEAVLAHGFFDATTFAGLYIVVKYFPQILKGVGISA